MIKRTNKFIHKLFYYRVRIAIPEKTGRVFLYEYEQALKSLVDRLCVQLKTQKRKFSSGGTNEGYDKLRGKYLEMTIIAQTGVNNPVTEKIIWIEQT